VLKGEVAMLRPRCCRLSLGNLQRCLWLEINVLLATLYADTGGKIVGISGSSGAPAAGQPYMLVSTSVALLTIQFFPVVFVSKQELQKKMLAYKSLSLFAGTKS
jgi:hypothetical protein